MAGGVELPPREFAGGLAGGDVLAGAAHAQLQHLPGRFVDPGPQRGEAPAPLQRGLLRRAAGAIGGFRREPRGGLAGLGLGADLFAEALEQRAPRLRARDPRPGVVLGLAQRVDGEHRVRRRRREAAPVLRRPFRVEPRRARRVEAVEEVALLLVDADQLARQRQPLGDLGRRRPGGRAQRHVGRRLDRLQRGFGGRELPADGGADVARLSGAGRRRRCGAGAGRRDGGRRFHARQDLGESRRGGERERERGDGAGAGDDGGCLHGSTLRRRSRALPPAGAHQNSGGGGGAAAAAGRAPPVIRSASAIQPPPIALYVSAAEVKTDARTAARVSSAGNSVCSACSTVE